jgi:hypothetical protein
MRELLLGCLVAVVACGDSGSSGSGAAGGGGDGEGGANSTGGSSTGGSATGAGGSGAGVPVDGQFTYGIEEGRVFRVEAAAGAAIEDVSLALDALAPGTLDRRLIPSFNGAWLTLTTDRVICDYGQCLAVISGDLASFEAVIVDGLPLPAFGTSPITNDGNTIVYSSDGGPHSVDLYRIDRAGDGWSSPTLLTADSSYDYNDMPALSFDEGRVYFDCGVAPYPEDGGTDSCSVALDGSGFNIVVAGDTLPDAEADFTQFPHAAVGGLLFQGNWPIGDAKPETIWFLPEGGSVPEPIGENFTNAVSPCGLRDGRFGLLWLDGPDNRAGLHELTLVAADGTLIAVLTPGIDVLDVGIGCAD